MSDFLTRLVSRARSEAVRVDPRPRSRFEPGTLEDVAAETPAPASPPAAADAAVEIPVESAARRVVESPLGPVSKPAAELALETLKQGAPKPSPKPVSRPVTEPAGEPSGEPAAAAFSSASPRGSAPAPRAAGESTPGASTPRVLRVLPRAEGRPGRRPESGAGKTAAAPSDGSPAPPEAPGRAPVTAQERPRVGPSGPFPEPSPKLLSKPSAERSAAPSERISAPRVEAPPVSAAARRSAGPPPVTPPARRWAAVSEDAAPEIRVHIGRVDVRSAPPPAPSAPRRPRLAGPRMTLADYMAARRETRR